jgi:hypothetical protein
MDRKAIAINERVAGFGMQPTGGIELQHGGPIRHKSNVMMEGAPSACFADLFDCRHQRLIAAMLAAVRKRRSVVVVMGRRRYPIAKTDKLLDIAVRILSAFPCDASRAR